MPCRVISDTRDRVGESPVWSVTEQALYWGDIEGRRIHRWDGAAGTVQSWHTPERVGCIVLSARGGLVAAMESGVFEVTLLAPPALRATLLVGITHPMDMGLASPVGAVFCLDEAGLSPARVDGLITPNGMAFSPDGRCYYLSDSHPSVQKIWAFDLDPANGAVSQRRGFIDMSPLPGRPDGAAVDEQGNYWICGNDAGLVHCFSPQGQLLRSVPVPVAKPSMCAFGGPDLRTLFVASILPATVSADQPGLNGAVFALDCGATGLPEPVFSRFPTQA
ncbi:MAG: SMP-30/gluconolactonase/LRE family protein [Betaproteobacteria bacterium]|nr:SMP-30/gluconolactonase/LRE family protein [Betaproteobacteria bacterium]